jgi:hypothetical protein
MDELVELNELLLEIEDDLGQYEHTKHLKFI